jgi:hypothetical protein
MTNRTRHRAVRWQRSTTRWGARQRTINSGGNDSEAEYRLGGEGVAPGGGRETASETHQSLSQQRRFPPVRAGLVRLHKGPANPNSNVCRE